jgi:hypothetical protein
MSLPLQLRDGFDILVYKDVAPQELRDDFGILVYKDVAASAA